MESLSIFQLTKKCLEKFLRVQLCVLSVYSYRLNLNYQITGPAIHGPYKS